MNTKLCRSTCYHHQLRNTVSQRTFTPHCLHRPSPSDSKKYLMYRTNWSARLITTAKWQKKYKKAFTIAHTSALGLGAVTATLCSAGIATAVTDIGAFASAPIGGVAAITGISSMLLTAFSKKKIQHKLTKHTKLYTLAITKKNTVCELVSKALNDNKISDSEFNLVLRQLEKFH